MKMSEQAIKVLKSFSALNPSIEVQPGNVIKTMANNKAVLAEATVPDEFDDYFSFYNINRFLGVMGMFDDPVLKFYDTHVVIKSGSRELAYTFTPREMFVTPPKNPVKIENIVTSFRLKEETMKELMKAQGYLKMPEVVIEGNGEEIALVACDVSGEVGDTYRIVVKEDDKVFKAVFKTEHLKFMEGDYDVDIADVYLAVFTGDNIKYIVSMEEEFSEIEGS